MSMKHGLTYSTNMKLYGNDHMVKISSIVKANNTHNYEVLFEFLIQSRRLARRELILRSLPTNAMCQSLVRT